MSLQPFPKPAKREVLGELLHSLSQPLTSLQCSLELSIDRTLGRQHDAAAVALEQMERVVGLVRLMREYLETESRARRPTPVPLGPVLFEVVDQMCTIALVRRIRLHLISKSEIMISVSEPQLRRAFEYLIGSLIDAQPAPCEITLRCEEDGSEFFLRAEVIGNTRADEVMLAHPQLRNDPVAVTSRRVRLAIAARLLESGGASLVFDSPSSSNFTLRVPSLAKSAFLSAVPS